MRPSDLLERSCKFVSNAPGHFWLVWLVWLVWRVWRIGSRRFGAYGAYDASVRITTDQKLGGSNPSERASVMSQDIGDDVSRHRRQAVQSGLVL
jgi:hypothetical protein